MGRAPPGLARPRPSASASGRRCGARTSSRAAPISSPSRRPARRDRRSRSSSRRRASISSCSHSRSDPRRRARPPRARRPVRRRAGSGASARSTRSNRRSTRSQGIRGRDATARRRRSGAGPHRGDGAGAGRRGRVHRHGPASRSSRTARRDGRRDRARRAGARPFHYSPLKLAEYFAGGRAVVAPDVPQMAARITPAPTRSWSRPATVTVLATALRRLHDDPALRARLGANARRRPPRMLVVGRRDPPGARATAPCGQTPDRDSYPSRHGACHPGA